jgi:hypothetical protein
MADEKEIKALIGSLREQPDPLHAGYSPSVHKLVAMGLDGALAVVDLLNAEDRSLRPYAQRVVEDVAARQLGWRGGQGFPDPGGADRFRDLIRSNGDYRPDAKEAQRRAAVTKWRRWLEEQRRKQR